jgi:hypothetical protein
MDAATAATRNSQPQQTGSDWNDAQTNVKKTPTQDVLQRCAEYAKGYINSLSKLEALPPNAQLNFPRLARFTGLSIDDIIKVYEQSRSITAYRDPDVNAHLTYIALEKKRPLEEVHRLLEESRKVSDTNLSVNAALLWSQIGRGVSFETVYAEFSKISGQYSDGYAAYLVNVAFSCHKSIEVVAGIYNKLRNYSGQDGINPTLVLAALRTGKTIEEVYDVYKLWRRSDELSADVDAAIVSDAIVDCTPESLRRRDGYRGSGKSYERKRKR